MAYPFPSDEWLQVLVEVLNSDERYAEVAENWEGDMTVVIEPDDGSERQDLPVAVYLDLWHGKCRSARFIDLEKEELPDAAFTLRARSPPASSGEYGVHASQCAYRVRFCALLSKGSNKRISRNIS